VFFYNSERYVETEESEHALAGNAPIVVIKADGSVHTTGTAYSIEHYLRKFEEQVRAVLLFAPGHCPTKVLVFELFGLCKERYDVGGRQTRKKAYLAVYDYGQGGVWAVIHARSKKDVERKYPALKVFDVRPAWMTSDHYERIRSSLSCDVDDESTGWFAMIGDERA
jgi:hypothetical protein